MASGAASAPQPEQFRDGDKVVFYGDSITHYGRYHYYIRLFYATRFPERNISFVNAGIAGSSATDSLPRLYDDVLSRKPGRVYVMFGINDVGRRNYKEAACGPEMTAKRAEAIKNYEASMLETVKKIRETGAAAVVVTPPPYDQYSAKNQTENYAACNDGLSKGVELIRKMAAGQNCPVIETHAPMTDALLKNPEIKFANDRVHPNPFGHMVIAYFILKAQGVPGIVAMVSVDSGEKRVVTAENCAVSNLEVKDGSLSFDYHAKSLPFPVSQEYKDSLAVVPWDELNREIIQIKGLPAGKYRLRASGLDAGVFGAADFAAGVNIAGLPTPNRSRAEELQKAVLQKIETDLPLRYIASGNAIVLSEKGDPSDFESADRCLDKWLEIETNKKFAGMIEKFRKNRAMRTELLKAAEDAGAKIQSLQKTESYKLALTNVPSE
jgi:lysophospholipase L1-like esterase